MAGLFIDLMEADFFPLGRRWKQRDRTRDERQLQVAFPIRARGHDNTPNFEERRFNDIEGTHVPQDNLRAVFLLCSAGLSV
jgi:hypothetical protein